MGGKGGDRPSPCAQSATSWAASSASKESLESASIESDCSMIMSECNTCDEVDGRCGASPPPPPPPSLPLKSLPLMTGSLFTDETPAAVHIAAHVRGFITRCGLEYVAPKMLRSQYAARSSDSKPMQTSNRSPQYPDRSPESSPENEALVQFKKVRQDTGRIPGSPPSIPPTSAPTTAPPLAAYSVCMSMP